jgi:hypothetical protein
MGAKFEKAKKHGRPKSKSKNSKINPGKCQF